MEFDPTRHRRITVAEETNTTADSERTGTSFWKFYLRPATDDEPQYLSISTLPPVSWLSSSEMLTSRLLKRLVVRKYRVPIACRNDRTAGQHPLDCCASHIMAK